MRVARFKPPRPMKLEGYDFDAFEVELHDDGGVDFRLVLGDNLDIFWVLPIERYGRLRLIHVDNAAMEIEPRLVRDPAGVELELVFDGDGQPLTRVTFVASGAGAYQCDLEFSDRPPMQLRYAGIAPASET